MPRLLLASAALLAIVIAVTALVIPGIRSILRDPRRFRSGGKLSAAVLEVQSLLEPSTRHVVDSVREREDEEQSRSGDPPER